MWWGLDSHEAHFRAVVRLNCEHGRWDGVASMIDRWRSVAVSKGLGVGTQPGTQGSMLWGYSRRLPRWGRGQHAAPAELVAPVIKRDSEFPSYHHVDGYRRQERDLVVSLETTDEHVLQIFVAMIEKASGVAQVRVELGCSFPEGRDRFGNLEGISNLQGMRQADPVTYRSYVYSSAPHEGSYYVFRKYRVNPSKFPDGQRCLAYSSSRNGRPREFADATAVIGRDRHSGLVVDRESGAQLSAQLDEAQAARALPGSHIAMANPRGRGQTSFGEPIIVAPARILRRSFVTADGDIAFQCFQASIKRGFELIHNEWLMSDFNGHPDPLLDPDAGLVEPVDTGYFFCPKGQDPWTI